MESFRTCQFHYAVSETASFPVSLRLHVRLRETRSTADVSSAYKISYAISDTASFSVFVRSSMYDLSILNPKKSF